MNLQKTHSQEELLQRLEEMERENRYLKSLLLTDEVTGLYNKRFFNIQLEVEMARTRRTGQPCSLIIMDLDDFKAVNDTLGHDVGDRLLVEFGGIVWQNLRPTDFACRIGGDEFAAIMPSSNPADSIGVAKRIRAAMAQRDTRQSGTPRYLSTSFGLATYEAHSPMDVADFFKKADLELYAAKRAGKDQISSGSVSMAEKGAVNDAERAALSQLSLDMS